MPKLKNWLANVGQSHGCKKMNYLQRPFKHFLVFMVNQEMNTRTKLLVRMHGKKLQTGRILLKKVILLFFCEDFIRNAQTCVFTNLLLKTEGTETYSKPSLASKLNLFVKIVNG